MTERLRNFSDLGRLLGGEAPPPSDSAPARPARDPLLARLTLRVRRETKGRKGKGVTVVEGFHHTGEDLAEFARALKTLCGAGGTVKDERIEVQGDHREKVAAWFQARGFRVVVQR
jgi:translation initiation factor 1